MLRPIPLDVLMTENEDIGEPELEVVQGISKVVDRQNIEKIIIDNINIQIALSDLYPFQNQANSNSQHDLGFLEGVGKNEQIEQFRYIFSQILVMSLKDEGAFCCAVIAPFKEVLSIFEKLLIQGKLSKWVTHFFWKKYRDDVSEIACYQYVPQENTKHDENPEILKDDEYFRYILFNKRYIIANNCIPVSGFTLQELDS
ncbi:MAG: hypothetical protein AAGU75_16780, partial [Bacillota bacterium]